MQDEDIRVLSVPTISSSGKIANRQSGKKFWHLLPSPIASRWRQRSAIHAFRLLRFNIGRRGGPHQKRYGGRAAAENMGNNPSYFTGLVFSISR